MRGGGKPLASIKWVERISFLYPAIILKSFRKWQGAASILVWRCWNKCVQPLSTWRRAQLQRTCVLMFVSGCLYFLQYLLVNSWNNVFIKLRQGFYFLSWLLSTWMFRGCDRVAWRYLGFSASRWEVAAV